VITGTEEGDMIVMEVSDRETNGEPPHGSRRSPWTVKLLAGAAVVLLIVGVLAFVSSDDGSSTSDGATSTGAASTLSIPAPIAVAPESVIEAYVEEYNSGDIDAVVALFREDSSVLGFPLVGVADGLEAIRSLHVRHMQSAAKADAYSFANLRSDGHTVTWDHRWTDRSGQDWCGTGHSAEVEDGAIVTWTWPEVGPAPCSPRSRTIEAFIGSYNSGDIDEIVGSFG
jgi:hypothetical protein